MSELRIARSDDAATLAELHASSFAKPWPEEEFRELLASPISLAFLHLHGFILARAAANEAEILTLAVRPSARRTGIGRALIEAVAERLTAQNGADAMFLEVVTGNIPALALYRGLGFGEVGRRKAYFEGQDALVLKAELPLSRAPLGK